MLRQERRTGLLQICSFPWSVVRLNTWQFQQSLIMETMKWVCLVIVLLLVGCKRGSVINEEITPVDPKRSLKVYQWNPAALELVQGNLGNSRYAAAYQTLLNEAEKAYQAPLLSVTQKQQTPPSNDKHDYYSLAPYYWPNPATPDGLPWLSRDGEVNPESDKITDPDYLDDTADNIITLATAFYFSRRERYAEKAAELLHTWFLNPATAMNPNLSYAQLRPGAPAGKIYNGIIEARVLADMVDAVGFLEDSKSWTQSNQAGFKSWCGKYLNWLLSSPQGLDEAEAKNNRGSWYVAQVVALSLRVGDIQQAGIWLNKAQQTIGSQFQPSGNQPEELRRTLALSYSAFNLEAHFRLAAMGQALGFSLWTFRDMRLRRGLEFILPYTTGKLTWPYQQIKPFEKERMVPLLLQSISVYGSAEDKKALTELGLDSTKDRANLLYP